MMQASETSLASDSSDEKGQTTPKGADHDPGLCAAATILAWVVLTAHFILRKWTDDSPLSLSLCTLPIEPR